jgi:CheY-like chemotaxis protein
VNLVKSQSQQQSNLKENEFLVAIEVEDNGIGIAPEHREKLFRPWMQIQSDLHMGGSGLGLFISHDLVRRMGGDIVYHTRTDGKTGSCFVVTVCLTSELNSEEYTESPTSVSRVRSELTEEEGNVFVDSNYAIRPFLSTPLQKVSDLSTEEPTSLLNFSKIRVLGLKKNRRERIAPYRILIAEDNKVNQMLILSMLQRFGYINTEISENGFEAVQLFQKQTFDMVFLDIEMPRMGGQEAAKKMRMIENEEDRPRCFMCGMSATALDEKNASLKFDAFLIKPFSIENIKVLVKEDFKQYRKRQMKKEKSKNK